MQTARVATLHEEKFLDSTAAKESRYNTRAIGKKGERSMYQMRESVWSRYCSLPFYCATSRPDVAHWVALCHLHYLMESLNFGSFHLAFSNHDSYQHHAVYKLALAWHYGLYGVSERGSNDEYALAVERLFFS